MGGKKKKGGILGSSLGSEVVDKYTRMATFGAISTSGKGFLEKGNPLEGNNISDSVLGANPAGGVLVDPYLEKKAAGEQLSKDAKVLAKRQEKDLLDKAKTRDFEEKAAQTASDDLARRRVSQLRRSRGTGRQSTILSGGSQGEQDLGTISTGNTLLGM